MIAYSYNGNGQSDSSLSLMTIHAIFYNQAKFAKATLESMLAQMYGNVEVIVSDDCSYDGTGEILVETAKSYVGPHKVIVNINESNMGIGDHFAFVSSLSNGMWQTSLGGDDLAEPYYLQTVAEYVKRYPGAVAIGCAATTIDETDNQIGEAYIVNKPMVYHRYESGPLTWSLSPGDDVSVVPVTGCVASYRKSLLDIAPFPKGVMSEDAFLGFRAPLVGDVLFIPEKCVRQRMSSYSIMRNGRGAKSRAERKAYRRRMSKMTYLSLNAALQEVSLLRPGLDENYAKTLSMDVAGALVESFALPDPFGENYVVYRQALETISQKRSVWETIALARARGVLMPTIKLILKGLLM